MLDPYRDRVLVAEIDANKPLVDTVDIALYDSFAQPESDHDEIDVLVRSERAQRVVVYTWNFAPELVESAQRRGAHGYLSKTLPARQLVEALEAVHAGETVVSEAPGRSRAAVGLDWPGRREGLTDREAEILASDHAGQEQRRGRRADLPEPEHGEVLHPLGLSQDRRRQPDASRALGRPQRVHPGPPPHRPLEGRSVTGVRRDSGRPTG